MIWTRPPELPCPRTATEPTPTIGMGARALWRVPGRKAGQQAGSGVDGEENAGARAWVRSLGGSSGLPGGRVDLVLKVPVLRLGR